MISYARPDDIPSVTAAQGEEFSYIKTSQKTKISNKQVRNRVFLLIAFFSLLYGAIIIRLAYFGFQDYENDRGPQSRITASRPDIIDRNGSLLATDVNMASLFAEPRRILDVDETIEKISSVIPELDTRQAYRKLKSNSGFVWLKRQIPPYQKAAVMQLGIPGIGFRTEKHRFYPSGAVMSHIIGLTDIDNKGISGLEKYIDNQGLADLQATGLASPDRLRPIMLSLDLRIQHIVRDEVMQAMKRFHAIAAGAIVLDVRTGEVLAMVSVPDFDPNKPEYAHQNDRMNRMSAGLFEMGSTFKSFTTAMALDSGLVNLDSTFDARHPLVIGRRIIRDFRGKGRVLTLPEVFIYSSNIGSAREADLVGIEFHRAFLRRLGLLDRVQTELPEIAKPMEPKVWKKIHSITIAFGHGLSTTPLQTAVAAAALMNGGRLIPPTFLARTSKEAEIVAKQVIQEKTSSDMRYLYRLNAEKGSGRRAEVHGYRVGGKTGTSEKVINGQYADDKRFNSFLAAFPIDNPQYVVLSIIDEPKPEKPGGGATAGLNAAPIVAAIIRRSAFMLGVRPDFRKTDLLVSGRSR